MPLNEGRWQSVPHKRSKRGTPNIGKIEFEQHWHKELSMTGKTYMESQFEKKLFTTFLKDDICFAQHITFQRFTIDLYYRS